MKRKLISVAAIFGVLVLILVCFLMAGCAQGIPAEWDKTFGGSGTDVFLSVQQTQDGGYITAGMTDSSGAGEDDIWLVKTDSEGNKKWDKTFGGSEQDAGFSAQQTQDGGYIIAGITGSYGAGEDDIWLIKTSG